nr:transposase [Clostridium estertheticum]
MYPYITNKPLRRRIQRGLNKGEAMNAFARAIFFLVNVENLEKESYMISFKE